jgi:hypothetical protein
MNFRYLNAMIVLMVCLGTQPAQAMHKEELEKLNASIARYERKARLSAKEAEKLKADRDRKYELERIHGLTSAEAPRAQQRQVQLQARRQQEAVQQSSEAPQSELRLQASVQTLQQGERPQPLQQQPQRAFSQQPQSRVQHAQSQQDLQAEQQARQQSLQQPSQDDVSWDEFIQQEIEDLFAEDKMKD